MRLGPRLAIAGSFFAIAQTAAWGCSCAGQGPFSGKLPDRTNVSVAVFTAEVVRFDPVAPVHAVPAPAGGDLSNRAYARHNSLDARAGQAPAVDAFPGGNRRVEFRVMDSFSGPEATPTEVWTHEQSTACGFDFVVGKKYLVEAQFWPPAQPHWTVNKCSRTVGLGTASSDEEVRVLQLWKAGKRPPSWITGRMFGYNEASRIAGVRLQLTDGKTTQFAQSGADGVFHFGNLSPGVYTLTADVPGTRNRRTIDLREEWSAAPVIRSGFPD